MRQNNSYRDINQESPHNAGCKKCLRRIVLGLDKQFLMLWTKENGFILRKSMYHHQNELTVGKTLQATVLAALAIWEKARIYEHFAQHVDSDVCAIRTLYDSYSLLKKNIHIIKRINLCIGSNKALDEFFDIITRRCDEIYQK